MRFPQKGNCMNYNSLQNNNHIGEARRWLNGLLANEGLPLVASLDTSGRKVRIARRGKAAKGSPVYWAHQSHGGHVRVTYSTFKSGQHSETFSTFDERRDSSPIHLQTAPSRPQTPPADAETAAKLALYARVISAYEHASPTGQSAYLERKGVADYAQHIPGLRYSNDGTAVYVPYGDVDGVAHGCQAITGQHKKGYGPAKGNFVVIGEQPHPGEPLLICEGVATGLSIFGATRRTVVCALSAGNLQPVASAWRAAGFKRHIFCADNDWADKKTGLARDFNPGLEAAHKAALASGGLVCAPDSLPAGESDYNDLHLRHGLQAVAQSIAAASRPDPCIAYAEEIRKSHKKPGLNTRYLDTLDLKPGVNIVKSPIGTGKTRGLIEHAKNAKSFLYISHLQSLATDAATRLNLSLYLDTNANELGYQPHLSICINSLWKLSNTGQTPRFEYVVIDEIEQLLQAVTRAMDNKPLILETLRFILSNAEKVVLLDAHVSEPTLRFVNHTLPGVKINFLVNRYEVGAGREIVLYDAPGDLVIKAQATLQNGGNAFICCNSKKEARGVFNQLKSIGFNGLYISGDNNGDENVRAFFADVNAQASLYDFIVVTPAANTGISIDTLRGHSAFAFVGGIFKNGITKHTDVIQAIGRVRGAEEIHLFVENRKGKLPRTDKEISSRWIQSSAEAERLGIELGIDVNGERVIVNALYSDVVLSVTRRQEKSQYTFWENVLKELAIEGYTFKWAFESETAKPHMKEVRLAENAEYSERILKAPEITEEQAATLSNKNRKTLEETDALDKHRIEKFYGEVSESILDFDRRGRGRSEISRLACAFMNDQEITLKHTLQASALEADRRPWQAQRLFAQLLLAAVTSEAGYHRHSPEVTQFVEAVDKHRAVLSAVAVIPSAKALRKNPIRFIGEQLVRHGLKARRTTISGVNLYRLDLSRYEFAAGIARQMAG